MTYFALHVQYFCFGGRRYVSSSMTRFLNVHVTLTDSKEDVIIVSPSIRGSDKYNLHSLDNHHTVKRRILNSKWY
jgi:hypothetical protein